jgi:hypothetical protein
MVVDGFVHERLATSFTSWSSWFSLLFGLGLVISSMHSAVFFFFWFFFRFSPFCFYLFVPDTRFKVPFLAFEPSWPLSGATHWYIISAFTWGTLSHLYSGTPLMCLLDTSYFFLSVWGYRVV